ncbi:cyclin domain-containing [Fusarium albosuccineum]|uniref:Cyclin domain-containing n=1 Tax=Fusarium albosuccineum TaxID=1237068 RepID=A0A8H4LEZ8_9HYPO|nr:cyclin domain-containing [Fusarium albosuccineum]
MLYDKSPTQMQPHENALRLKPLDHYTVAARQLQGRIAGGLSRLTANEYLDDVIKHMHTMEEETLPDTLLIDMQWEIEWSMRPYLIDFIVEAHNALTLRPETLFLTVNLVDRYCSRRVVYKQHYQLVGCAALLIAAKYGDDKDRVPRIHELRDMCCGFYDAEMFIQMEMHILNAVSWVLGHPTVVSFLQLMETEEAEGQEVEHMAVFICEITLYHRDFVSTKASIKARVILALARAILGTGRLIDGDWGRAEKETLSALFLHIHNPSSAVTRRYSGSDLSRVAQKLANFLAG